MTAMTIETRCSNTTMVMENKVGPQSQPPPPTPNPTYRQNVIVFSWETKKLKDSPNLAAGNLSFNIVMQKLINHQYRKLWTDQHNPLYNDQTRQLLCQEQTTIFRRCTETLPVVSISVLPRHVTPPRPHMQNR